MKTKIARFYKDELETQLFEKEYYFKNNKIGCGKIIVTDLEANENMFSVLDIKTKKELKVFEYTKKDNPELVITTNFYKERFKSNKEMFDFLDKDDEIEFINSINTIYVIE